jgi:antitoxin component YwqK of YwqJK toxin-antitoxin module
MEGVLYEYHRTGNVKKEVHYKNGLQHGLFRYYDPDGNLTLEYEYRDGEKVSGGIVPE